MLGVCWKKQTKKWVAQITVSKKKIHLGYFDTSEQAYAAFLEAKRKLHATNTL